MVFWILSCFSGRIRCHLITGVSSLQHNGVKISKLDLKIKIPFFPGDSQVLLKSLRVKIILKKIMNFHELILRVSTLEQESFAQVLLKVKFFLKQLIISNRCYSWFIIVHGHQSKLAFQQCQRLIKRGLDLLKN